MPSVADEFLRLATLNYSQDHPSRREKALTLLTEHPGLARENIYIAAATGDADEVAKLLGADPSLAAKKGGPLDLEPLLYATYSRVELPGFSTLAAAKVLLDHGADPDTGFFWQDTKYYFSALTGAFGEGEAGPINQPPHAHWKELATLLLEKGADPNDSQALYNRMFTRGTSHLELLFAYGLGTPDNEKNRSLLASQLHWAAKEGHLDRVELFIQHGVNLDTPSDGRTPYETALLQGHRDIAERLLAHGATKKELDPEDAFAAALLRGDEAETSALLTTDPMLSEKLGPLRFRLMREAAEKGLLPALRLMHSLGFPLHADDSGVTPLHQAAWHGRLEAGKLLVTLGCDLSARDKTHNATPADWAAFNHHPELAVLLTTPQGSP